MRLMATGVAAVVGLSLGACAYQPVQAPPPLDNPPVYSPSRGTEPQLLYGVVGAINQFADRRAPGTGSGAGALIGGVAGAIIGRQFGNSGDGRATGTVLGAFGGAILGDHIEREQGGRTIVRVSVNLERGGTRSFDFSNVGDLRVGDRVRIENNQLYRL
jgi:outer membrane lipoprotein SlyB